MAAARGSPSVSAMSQWKPTRVLVAGGGVAGLEAVLALQELAGERVRIELLAPERHFVHRAMSVAEPFDNPPVQRFPLAAIAADRGIVFHRDALLRVLDDRAAVATQGGARIDFDALVIATGGRIAPALPGAVTFRGPQDAARMRAVVTALREGLVKSAAFVVPAATSWALPLYELALQTAHALRGDAVAELTVVSAEPEPLEPFGPAAGELVRTLLEDAGVRVRTGVIAHELAGGELDLGAAGKLPADRVIAMPRIEGPRLAGVPADPRGFIPVDAHMRARDEPPVYAVGDAAAAGVKQGGLAAQQADAAAAAIAAAAGAPIEPEPYRPVLRGVLLAGATTHFLRNDPTGMTEVSDELLWWPPGKVAARHLSPYLASRTDLAVTRVAPPADPLTTN
jgi:sulfide:quinone oxidoreductase